VFWLRAGVEVVEESLLGILKTECFTFYLILEIRNSKKVLYSETTKNIASAFGAPTGSPQTFALELRQEREAVLRDKKMADVVSVQPVNQRAPISSCARIEQRFTLA